MFNIWFLTNIAHLSSTGTSHMITSLSFEKLFATLPTFSYHSFSHFVFDVSSFSNFFIFFHFITSKKNRDFFRKIIFTKIFVKLIFQPKKIKMFVCIVPNLALTLREHDKILGIIYMIFFHIQDLDTKNIYFLLEWYP